MESKIPALKDGPKPVYRRVKQFVRERITSGGWPEGFRLPPEPDFARQLEVSRMTANRALGELVAEGLIERRPGAGTYVKKIQAQSTYLKIQNISDEIKFRGNQHSSRVLLLERTKSEREVAQLLNIPAGDAVFHSIILHMENRDPVQLEDRFVNAQFAPDYLLQNFTETTPTEYLLRLGPVDEFEHVIQSIVGDEATRKTLSMKEDESTLLLKRRTWSDGLCVTTARLYHPGLRYSLSGTFKANQL